jgi:cytochrome bd-type quinol oxidase subunit 1
MTNVDLARWQFAFVTVNHFFFVPVTIGLAFLTALLQTAWYRGKKDEYLRLTRFFGTLLVINVAIGVVTGIVQEFQFGMNWGAYSRAPACSVNVRICPNRGRGGGGLRREWCGHAGLRGCAGSRRL